MASKDTGVQMANGTDDLIWITPHICIKKTVAEKTATQTTSGTASGDKTKDAGVGGKQGVQAGSFGTSQKQAEQTSSAAAGNGGLESALAGMLHGPTIKGDTASKEKAPIVGPDGIPKEEVRWGPEYVTLKQGAATAQSAAPVQAAATIKSADTTQSAAPPGPGLSAALDGMLRGPTIKGDKTSKEKAPIVGPDGIPKEEVRWGSEYVTLKQGAATAQSAAPVQAAATIKSADTTQSAAPPGPGLSAALEGMLHGPTIKGDKTSKEKAPIVGPGGVPKEEVRWGSEYVTDKQGAATMQSAAPVQAAATIKSADTTQSAAPPGPGLSAALEGMLHGPTIKGDKASKEKAPIVGPGGVPKEEIRWGSEYVTDKQGAATMQSAAPVQAAATIKSADTTQSAAPPGPGLSAALEGMLHGPTIKDKTSKEKAPIVGPGGVPKEEIRWGSEYVTDKQGAATMQSAAPVQAAATIKSADTTQSAAPPGPGLSAALEGMLHGPTIKGDKSSKEKAPIVGPGGVPKEEIRWGSEYVTDKQGAATMQSAAPTQAAATIKSADTTQSAAPPGPGLSAALEGMLHGPTIKDKTSKEKAPIVGPGGVPKEEVRWGTEYVTDKQGAATMQSAAPVQAAATIKSADTTQSAAPPGPGLSAALEGMLHGPTIKDKTSKEKVPIVGPGGVPKEEVRWGSEYVTDKQGAATMQSAAPTQAAATIKSADTTQSAAPPGPGLSAALEGMLHGPTIKDKTSKEKAPVVGPEGIPKEEVRWGSEYVTDKQGAATMQSAAPVQAAATIKSADTTQSAAPPGPGLSAAQDVERKAPIVGPGGVPKEEVRWGSEYVTDKHGAATMQSAAPVQAAATIKSADTTQSAAPPGPGLSAALEGMLHGPTIKGDKSSKEKAPIVGPGGVPKEEVRWGSEYVTDKQGAATMQSAAPTQAAATIKSADTTQSAAPPGPGLSAALEGMLHGPTIKGDKTSKEKAPIVGPDGIPKEEVRWGSEYVTDKQGAATMQSAAPVQAAATIKSADTTQSAAPPGPGLSAALEGMLHGPTIKDKNQKKKNAPVVGPDSIPTEEVRWGAEYSGKEAKGQKSGQKSGGRKGSGKKKGKK
ncbi:hypothetical protein Bbelb_044290 [Branchiostoma belcheri]|nr:hypothetical protein Bbelb_044290 [Branchiostoma belcheri]